MSFQSESSTQLLPGLNHSNLPTRATYGTSNSPPLHPPRILGTLHRNPLRLAEPPMKALLIAALLLTPTALQAQGIVGRLDATGRAAMDAGIDMLASALARALQSSRDQARAEGTLPIPPHIHTALLAIYPADLLQDIEYRVGTTDDATLQSYAIRHGEALAITTIDTIIFANPNDAAHNVALWVHEVKHVEQFRRWGVLGFARRYVQNHQAVEAEAYAAAAAFHVTAGNGG